MRGCELCGSPARILCESDQAILCWDCDFKVHGANFLVARHSRILLCQACQLPTPWSASGAKLGGPTVSFCVACSGSDGAVVREETESRHGDEIDLDSSMDDDDVDDDDGNDDEDHIEDDEEDEGGNQVVPWSYTTPPPPPPEPSCSSGGEDELRSFDSGVSTTDLGFQGNVRNNARVTGESEEKSGIHKESTRTQGLCRLRR